MVQQAEDGIRAATSLLAPEPEQQAGDGERDDQHAPSDVDLQRQAEGDADEARLRHRLAEVGHALPDDETAERGCDDGEPEAATSARTKNGSSTYSSPAPDRRRLVRRGCGMPARSWLWS